MRDTASDLRWVCLGLGTRLSYCIFRFSCSGICTNNVYDARSFSDEGPSYSESDLEHGDSDTETGGDLEHGDSDTETRGDLEHGDSDTLTRGDLEHGDSDTEIQGDLEHGDSDGESDLEPGDGENSESTKLCDCSEPQSSTAHLELSVHTESESEVQHQSISSGDFGKVVQLQAHRNLTDHEKVTLLKRHFVPTRSFKFPSRLFSGHTRHFQRNWLDQYNGLVYSESEDGGYCKFCVLFGKCGPTMKEFGVLVTRPLTDFKRATEKLHDHFHCKKFHKAALEAATAFTTTMENPEIAIDRRLSSQRSKHAAVNRLKLLSIAETVIFCGKQGLAFRGHRDDMPAVRENPAENHGNFLALLQFRVQAGDQVLKEHLRTAAGNALYTSKTIQNEMIVVCGDIIRNKLLEKIRKAGFFSVIADEATDTANDEQLSISIRFVDCNSPCEKFLTFHECQSGVSGEAIADDVLTKLVEWQLQPQLLRGQAYDGAGAMAGKTKGVAARIKSKHPKAVYTH